MDFTKLLSLLEYRQLFFARADQFEDPYEGAWSKAGVKLMRDSNLNGGLPSDAMNYLIEAVNQWRKEMFISCWIVSEHESAAMWKTYLQSPEGIAIRSDHNSLISALQSSKFTARTTMVRYIDYDQTPIPFGNGFFPFVHKRMSFSYENELRAIIWSGEEVNKPHVSPDATSLPVDIVPQNLIQAVHVAPTAPKWFGILVERLLQKYELTCPVVRSGLYDRPSY